MKTYNIAVLEIPAKEIILRRHLLRYFEASKRALPDLLATLDLLPCLDDVFVVLYTMTGRTVWWERDPSVPSSGPAVY
jgi:hypothetical protein